MKRKKRTKLMRAPPMKAIMFIILTAVSFRASFVVAASAAFMRMLLGCVSLHSIFQGIVDLDQKPYLLFFLFESLVYMEKFGKFSSF